MINPDAQHRPTAEALMEVFGTVSDCCNQRSPPFDAAEQPSRQSMNTEIGTLTEEPAVQLGSLPYPAADEVFAHI